MDNMKNNDMTENNLVNSTSYGGGQDDGNIPEIDLPQSKNSKYDNVEPLPESSRPRKDGPGGDDGE